MKGKIISWAKILHEAAPAAPAPVAPVAPATVPATNNLMLKKRARSKFLSFHIASELAALNSPLKKSYINTQHCGETITQQGDKLTSAYCGNRWCLVCARIRTGKLMNSYLDLSASLTDKHFVTLTVRNIKTEGKTDKEIVGELRYYQRAFYKWCRKTTDSLRKQNIHVKGIRNFENKPSVDGKGFHPHLHWLIDGTCNVGTVERLWLKKKLPIEKWIDLMMLYGDGEITEGEIKGELLIQMWLKHFDGQALRQGQDVRKATAGTEKELFKYETKFTVGKGNEKKIPLRMLDLIYQASRNVRTVNVTGFITRKPTEPKLNCVSQDVKNELVKLVNGMKISGDYKREPILFEDAMRLISQYNSVNADLFIKQAHEVKVTIWKRKCAEWQLYRILTKKMEEEITEDLESQEGKAGYNGDVFQWHNDNWYSTNTGRPLVRWELTKRFSNFLLLMDSS